MSDLVSEDHILARIASHFPNEGPDVLLGRGDDCAVLGVSGPLCVSTDLFMEDVHFRRAYFTPEDIGWKALAVNLSDLAADGARPMGFTVGLSLPPDADMALVDGLCAGIPYHTLKFGGIGKLAYLCTVVRRKAALDKA